MSYCRFGWDGSDVYVITTPDGIECVMCALHTYRNIAKPEATGWEALAGSIEQLPDDIQDHFEPGPHANQQMIEHLELHIKQGHRVPETALARLRNPLDIKENLAHWAKWRKQ